MFALAAFGAITRQKPPERFNSHSHRSVPFSPGLISVNLLASVLQDDITSSSGHGALRSLQQLGGLAEGPTVDSSSSSSSNSTTTAAAGPDAVSTPTELIAAVVAGAQDVRVNDHMDLTGLDGFAVLDPGVIPMWNLRSIRVCSSQ